MGVKMKVFLLLNVLILNDVVHSSDPRIDPLVHIKQGIVRGQLADDGRSAYFLGIPYAEVNPTNPFGNFNPHHSFGDDVFNAYESVACPQPSTNEQQSLDCLRLNIHVPYEATSKNPLPVLVWIHGGKFYTDQASTFDPTYFMKQGIVVVTINYRLGPYGFMCLDTPLVPGNQGLKDQYEALRWVRNNIAAFGGNPYEVTIAGQSAGSCSTILQLFSAKDKLFKRIIAQSGTPFSNGMFVEGDTQAAIKLAEQLDFNTTNTEEALEFLAQTSPDFVISAFNALSLDLKPCKERSFSGIENFVETYPYYMSNEKKIKNTPIMIGHTSREEERRISEFSDDYFMTDIFYERLNEVFDFDDEHLLEAASIVRHFYIGDEDISRDSISELANFESDFNINHPIQRMINHLLKEDASPVYEYVFSYLGDSNKTETSQGDELPYMFNTKLNTYFDVPTDNDNNKLMIERLTTLWANFVKFGNPTPSSTELLPALWEPLTEKTRPYMVIDKELQMKSRVYHDRMAFWNLFFDKYASNQRLTRECTVQHRDNVETEDV